VDLADAPQQGDGDRSAPETPGIANLRGFQGGCGDSRKIASGSQHTDERVTVQ